MVRSKMTKSQKEINDVMVQVLEEVIFPRFDKLEEKIQNVNGKVEDLDEKVAVLDEKVCILDEKVDYTNRRLDVLVDEFKDHDKRITKLEVRVGFVVN